VEVAHNSDLEGEGSQQDAEVGSLTTATEVGILRDTL
jgi:hypothetical protein